MDNAARGTTIGANYIAIPARPSRDDDNTHPVSSGAPLALAMSGPMKEVKSQPHQITTLTDLHF